MRKICLSLLLGGCATLSLAKTVALWPLEYDTRLKENNLRCMVNAANDLTMRSDAEFRNADALPWAQPPNPDTDRHLYDCDNAWAVWSKTDTGKDMLSVNSPALAQALCVTNDFTVEGWVNVQRPPATNEWRIIMNAFSGGNSKGNGGWTLSLRRQSASNYNVDFVLYVKGNKLSDVHMGGKFLTDAELVGFTNRWIHLALTHRARNANNREEWTLFTNGVSYATVEGDHISNPNPGNGGLFELGGRNSSDPQRLRAGFDYWRISDAVLDPSEFLCAGGAGTPVAVDMSPTRYYWKLDRTADGKIDTSSQVGRAPLSMGFPTGASNSGGMMYPSTDAAFGGQPPNTTVTLPDGNTGSFFLPGANCYWRFDDPELGRRLDVDQDFTIEGWFKPLRSENVNTVLGRLFVTRSGNDGWLFHIHNGNNANHQWALKVYAQQTNGVMLAIDANLSGDLTAWAGWKHVALVYDHAAGDGKGTWTLYLDGEQFGCHTNLVAPTVLTDAKSFTLGGESNGARPFTGWMDCVRVTGRALAPEQLLCEAENPQDVDDADVLAFWPLNASANGLACIGTDLRGKYSFAPEIPANRMPASVADAPTITNPDATWTFGGGTNLSGSAAFNSAESGNADHSCLRTDDAGVREVFRGTAGWTVEFYIKHTAAVSDWEMLFGVLESSSLSAGRSSINFAYRTAGFCLYDYLTSEFGDTYFPNSTGSDLKVGEWNHVALVCDYQEVDGVRKVIHEVFVDGVSKGTITHNARNGASTTGKVLTLGGRAHSPQSVKGYLSSVRLSSRPLAPSEFLCAPGPAPVAAEPVTLAMWPLDWTDGALDRGSRVMSGAGFSSVEDVTGSTETARARVPNADPSEDYEGDPKRNVGSVTFGATGCLSLNSLGTRTEVSTPFTVEGWVKWAHADAPHGHEVIVGTYLTTRLAGWKLYVDTTGATPALRLFAQPVFPCSPLVGDATLVADISSWKDVWKHVALVYDPKAGRGTWSCYVDGKLAGMAENIWAPQGATYGVHAFALGRFASNTAVDAFAGEYDMWRLTQGVLTPEEFLYNRVLGTLLLLR